MKPTRLWVTFQRRAGVCRKIIKIKTPGPETAALQSGRSKDLEEAAIDLRRGLVDLESQV
jgi:hypothetical protein